MALSSYFVPSGYSPGRKRSSDPNTNCWKRDEFARSCSLLGKFGTEHLCTALASRTSLKACTRAFQPCSPRFSSLAYSCAKCLTFIISLFNFAVWRLATPLLFPFLWYTCNVLSSPQQPTVAPYSSRFSTGMGCLRTFAGLSHPKMVRRESQLLFLHQLWR